MPEMSFAEWWARGNCGGAVASVVVRDGRAYLMEGQLVVDDECGPAPLEGMIHSPVVLLVRHAAGDVYFSRSKRLDLAMDSLHHHTARYGSHTPEWRRLPPGWILHPAGVPVRAPTQSPPAVGDAAYASDLGTADASDLPLQRPTAAVAPPARRGTGIAVVDDERPPVPSNAAANPPSEVVIPETAPDAPASAPQADSGAAEIRAWLGRCGWSAYEAARRTGIAESSLSRWMRQSGGRSAPTWVRRIIDVTDQLGAEQIERWQPKRLRPRGMRDWVWAQGSQRRAAAALGVSQSQVSRWADGSREVPRHIARLVDLLGRV